MIALDEIPRTASQNLLQRRIKRSICGVVTVVDRVRMRFDDLGDFYEAFDVAPVRKDADANAGDKGDGHSRAASHRNFLERQTDHIGCDLGPDPRFRSAVGDADAAWGVPALGQDVEMVAESVGDAFENSAEQVAALDE